MLGNKSSDTVSLVDIQKIHEMLARLRLSKFFSSLYLRSGFNHIKLSPETRHKNTFTTTFGRYEFLRMPFDPAQGPAYFTVLMQKVLGTFHQFGFFPHGLCASAWFK